ncbi:MAG: ATP synthase F1 subunit gamma [Planctomycetes bacterium]|nr:ATP synthase F1 subunit gamma [Planctomycetota bacterium]MCB9910676.1 ATP synthase F1 subunit gamma [Planctomycetota bacterium]HPF14543.1 ATP synthase F1 subunit gamma [Planctomycetota bacterium]
MAGIKELRGRITSVGNIRQITRAMEMVATTKLRRFQDRAVSSRPYSQEITGLVARLCRVLGDGAANQPLLRPGAGEKTLALVVTSDRGLCGAYNSNLLRVLEIWRKKHGRAVDYMVYGRKGFGYMDRRDFEITRYIKEPGLELTDYRSAAISARMLAREFLSGKYRDVVLVFTAFESMVRYKPQVVTLLPVSPDELLSEAEETRKSETLLEPDAGQIFDSLVPRYLETRVYNALLESLTSEYASRRFAMTNATDAASEMRHELRGKYNKLRQEKITKELLDIVGGVEALK